MRRAVPSLLAAVPLAACSSGASSAAPSSSNPLPPEASAASTPASAPTPVSVLRQQDPAVATTCLKLDLDALTLGNAISGTDDQFLETYVRAVPPEDTPAGQTPQGKAAAFGLAQLNVAMATGKALATARRVPDRAALGKALADAKAACLPFTKGTS